MSAGDPWGISPSTAAGNDPWKVSAAKTSGQDPWNLAGGGGRAKAPHDVLTNIEGAIKTDASNALGGVNAVLGAPERAVQGAIGSHGNILQRAGYGAYGAFHPNDVQFNRNTLDTIEGPLAKTKGLAKVGVDLTAQTLLDPLTYIPFIGEGKLGLRAAGKLGEVYHALPSSLREDIVEPVRRFFSVNPGLSEKLGGDQNAVKVYEGVYATARSATAQQAKIDAELLRTNAAALRKGDMPPEVLQRLQQYIPFNAGHRPLGALGKGEENLYDDVAQRLALARGKMFEDAVNDRLTKEMVRGTVTSTQAQAMRDIKQPPIGNFGPLRGISDIYRAALFVNPLPHMFNVARLAYYAGGMKTVGRGLKYFAKGTPEDVRAPFEEYVGRPEYLAGAPTKGEEVIDRLMPGVGKMRNAGQGVLSNFDAAMRASYMKELAGGNEVAGQRGFDIAHDVRNSFGGYQESPAVRLLTNYGAPFAAWRLGVVPRAMGKALVEHPERVERYARAFQTGNQDLGTNVEFGGPEEDFAKLADFPSGTKAYLASPSTIGQIPGWIAGQDRPQTMEQAFEQLARSYVPGGNIAEEAAGLSPYAESQDRMLDLLLSLFGGYTKKK